MRGLRSAIARVTQQEDFGYVESAPTRHIYPAKMSKAVLTRLLHILTQR